MIGMTRFIWWTTCSGSTSTMRRSEYGVLELHDEAEDGVQACLALESGDAWAIPASYFCCS